MHFDRFDTAAFLRDHWQKAPLLVRNPWTTWENPVTPDELAGLACEEDVEARLIMRTPRAWAVEQGPFSERRFGRLGKQPSTLLVQAVDHHVPEVAALIAPFRFIPDWRIDDVMVSYATDGGGVGPHFDQYDVFLVQGLGKRRWQVGQHCNRHTPLLAHDDLRLLADFEPVEEWVLEPGDMLYVPPGLAHNGIAIGDDCMTYSIGFRAPSRSELIAHWADALLDELSDDDRYRDPDDMVPGNPGEISQQAIGALHAMVTQTLHDRDAFARWFGRYTSTRRYPDIDWSPEEPVDLDWLHRMAGNALTLSRNAASRFAFVERAENGVLFFVDGDCHECHAEAAVFARSLCAQTSLPIEPQWLTLPAVATLIAALYNGGAVTFGSDD
ncbi:cupin domain-containing protein [Sphingobium algorifonticola]|uniref:Cupin domain-containing protein n=1 Tax=Sphingobium algorifonticola TaxID=2008318 RepID=A0A437J5T9_9SPHN|nr:cupin domain-containing protein [Sphingobium algorifonticola]RVT40287.1 cupin domain-containing protein [Sphingobium algorifonticola]